MLLGLQAQGRGMDGVDISIFEDSWVANTVASFFIVGKSVMNGFADSENLTSA